MRKFLSIFTVTATLVGLAGCSQNEITDTTVDTDQPVEIKVAGKTLGVTPHTRMPFEGDGEVAIDARVIVSSTSLNYSALVTNGIIEFAANTASGFNPAVPYPHADNSVYLIGLYPAASSADWTLTSNTASFTFNGTHDVMATRQVESKRAEAVAGTYKKLTFHHLLTRLNLCIQAVDAAAQTAWGEVKSIKVKSPSTGITIDLLVEDNTNKPTTDFNSVAGDFSFYTIATDNVYPQSIIPLKPAASSPALTAQSYSLVGPKGLTGSNPISYDITIVTENHTGYTVNVPLKDTGDADFTGNTQGLQFDITLTFTATDIKALATVNKWETGGTGGGTIQ